MPFRPSFRAISAATALAIAPVGAGASAQSADAGLRADGSDGFANPTPLFTDPGESPPTAPTGTPPLPTPAAPDNLLLSTTQRVPDDPNATNYGKPRPKKSKLYRPNAKTSPPLPALVPYRGAPGLPRGLLNPRPAPRDAIDPPQPAPTVAVIPSPDRVRKPLVDDDPYAPVGVAAGSLRLFPFVETTGGYETNPNQTSAVVKASPTFHVEAGTDVRSDFSQHSLTASLRGGYTDYPDYAVANRPDASGLVDGRIDVTRDDKIDLEGRFGLTTQTPGSPLLAVPGSTFITNRATIATEGATIGETHAFNRLSLSLRGSFDRTQYGDATQNDGSIVRFSQDNYNDYGLLARAAYEVTPALIPFVEAGFDARVRDQALDLSGYARNSTGELARVGSTFEFTRLLTGTASVGYASRHYDDSRLPELRGPTVDGTLVYTFSPLTKLTLSAATILSETTLPAASGAISRNVSLELAHVFFRNFTVSGIATYQVNQYQGVSVHEDFTQGTLKAAYNVNREVQIIASATRQRLDSSLIGSSFTDNIFLAGVRLQR